jgi:tubulin beta
MGTLGTKILEVLCDEHGIGGHGEYCGDNDAQLGHINVFYHEASGGKYEIDDACTSPLGELFRLDNLVNQNAGAGNNWALAHYT